MLAFVLSGGTNKGALQVGAMRALLERGYNPEFLIGSSIGSINAAYMAHKPTLEGLDGLAELWQEVTQDDVFPGGWKTALWRFIRQESSLYPNDRWHAFIKRQADQVERKYFGELDLPCYVLATDLETGKEKLFGENPNDSILDALLASTALPVMFPPWEYNGRVYIDGGVSHHIPIYVAVDKGATRIISLDIVNALEDEQTPNTIIPLAQRSFDILSHHNTIRNFDYLLFMGNMPHKYITLSPGFPMRPTDFSNMEQLLHVGYNRTIDILDDKVTIPIPNRT